MGKRSEYKNGTFCWPELATSDTDKAKEFYSEVMGWTTTDMPLECGGYYSMWQLGEDVIGAMYKLVDDQIKQNIPPHWIGYVSVDSIEETIKKINSLNGKILMGPADVGDAGRMAFVQDPQGANFALWQGLNNKGASLVNDPGSLCWNELATKDIEAAKSFYCGVFGWTVQTDDSVDHQYTVFYNGEAMAGGMMEMTEEWGDMPPHWMIYFSVKDTDRQCEVIEKSGGNVCVPPMDIDNIGRFAVVNDPQGATFSIIDLNSPDP
ncbi:VOC family protein [Aliikangiella sp. G2MR2-5]|uniref:VOC family protein n=1 Tax=Aliikangiella sp. G2MR2-5 TaxID=2788943 RepID=UPI0018AC79A2|nr:VOC family protein [Aliikangiella sp. G2MR2-5]